MRFRDRLLRKFPASKAEQDLNVFKKQKNFVVNLVNRTKAEYFKTTIEENRFHPKALWSTGMDGISVKILKISCNQILAPLLHTINLSFNTSNVLSAWKAAKVTPV